MRDLYRWGIAFLVSDARLTYGQRQYIIDQAAMMLDTGQEEKDISLRIESHPALDLEGRITTKGEPGVLGSYVGIKYAAEIETSKGKVNIAFLMSEQTGRVFANQAKAPEIYNN